ncbi:hypothetical protein G3N57_18745 [Paraburkholderia sp. Se-20369]|nr:hypothetical protein [Paraburkholderia sp. Se-20369]
MFDSHVRDVRVSFIGAGIVADPHTDVEWRTHRIVGTIAAIRVWIVLARRGGTSATHAAIRRARSHMTKSEPRSHFTRALWGLIEIIFYTQLQ